MTAYNVGDEIRATFVHPCGDTEIREFSVTGVSAGVPESHLFTFRNPEDWTFEVLKKNLPPEGAVIEGHDSMGYPVRAVYTHSGYKGLSGAYFNPSTQKWTSELLSLYELIDWKVLEP